MKKILKLSLAAVLGLAACNEPLDEIKENVDNLQLFSPANVKVTVHKQVTAILTWEAVNNATDYNLELYSVDATDSIIDSATTTKTTYTFGGLTENVEYEVRVCANSPSIPQSKWTVVTFDTKPIKYETIEWNFSDTEFDLVPATIPKDSSYTVRGLKFIGGTAMVRDTKAPAKFGEISFPKRINTGGASVFSSEDPKLNARLLYISETVTKAGVLEVYAQSNGTDTRVLQVLDKSGKMLRELETTSSNGAEVNVLRMPCSEKTDYYISGKASINIYMVRLLVGAIYEVDTVSTLKSLAVTGETLVPAFHPDTFEYTVNVPNGTKEVTITTSGNHTKQIIEGGGKKTLSSGTTYIDEFFVKVTAEDGEHTKAYSIVVKRVETASKDATLKTLKVSPGTLTPTFNPNVTEYTDTVTAESVTIEAEASHKFAKVGNNGKIEADNLKMGVNGPYSIVVLAEDLTVKTYTVTVVRKAPAGTVINKWWNFSDAAFSGLPAEFTDSHTIDDLTILAGGSAMRYNGNDKSMDGYSFTHRLQLNGIGDITKRVLKFDVTGACKITVYMVTGSGTAVRPLVVHNGTDELTKLNTDGSGICKGEYSYTGGAGSIYLYSGDSGINLYGVKVEY